MVAPANPESDPRNPLRVLLPIDLFSSKIFVLRIRVHYYACETIMKAQGPSPDPIRIRFPIQIQLSGHEVRPLDAETPSSSLLTLGLVFRAKTGGNVNPADILIVDDDPDMLQALQMRLKANGYDVHCAEDGIGAISEARKHIPDLIVLDLGIPSGDGFVVLNTLKTSIELSSIPVIVLSGRDRKANEQRVLNAGAKVFLQKPVQSHEFLGAIRHALGEASQKPGWLYD
jgi:CheY-like chemotaxis protein